MTPDVIGYIGIACVFILILMRTPVAAALGIVGLVGIGVLVSIPRYGPVNFSRGFDAAFAYAASEPFSYVTTYTFAAVPLFLLMGFAAYHSGLTADLFRAALAWLSRLPGGLAISSVLGCAMFSSICGSSMATAAAMGRLAVPEMLKHRYDPGLSTAVIAASGTLGSLIPPSILMVIYGLFTGQSVGRLFIAGFIPGILSALIYMVMIYVRVKLNPELAPTPSNVAKGERLSSFLKIWHIVVLFILVTGSIYLGVATPTEAAAIGALGVCMIGFLTRRLGLASSKDALLETAKQTGSIFAIVVGAKLFVGFVALSGVATQLSGIVTNLDVHPMLILAAICLLYIVLGMFMDAIGMMLLTLPIIAPIVSALGFDLVWFGIIIIKLLEIGLVTPPVGLNIFVMKGVIGNRVSLETIFRGIGWFLAMDVFTLILLIAFPSISLMLPNLLM